jgi:hypothetical protein
MEAAIAGTVVTLQFLAVPNRSYSLLYKDSLNAPDWSKLRDIESQSTSRVVVEQDAIGVLANRFYRLVTPRAP